MAKKNGKDKNSYIAVYCSENDKQFLNEYCNSVHRISPSMYMLTNTFNRIQEEIRNNPELKEHFGPGVIIERKEDAE